MFKRRCGVYTTPYDAMAGVVKFQEKTVLGERARFFAALEGMNVARPIQGASLVQRVNEND
jgi:hypothetical protein